MGNQLDRAVESIAANLVKDSVNIQIMRINSVFMISQRMVECMKLFTMFDKGENFKKLNEQIY